MVASEALAERIIEAISKSPCALDELLLALPDCTWNQIFLEVDRLSRAGHVRLTLEDIGIYRVRLRADEGSFTATKST